MIKKKVKLLGSISMYILVSIVLVLALACGGDDDDDDDTSGAGATSGSSGTTGPTAGTTGPSAGTTGDTAGAGDVPAGSECNVAYRVMDMIDLFTSVGICQQASDPCVGGTPDKFDIAALVPADVSSMLPPPVSAQANCAEGLVCCIKDDQCAAVSQQLTSNPLVTSMLAGISIECVTTGTCSGDNAAELPLGCPTGQGCCVDIPEINLDGAIPLPGADAGTQ